MPGQVGAAVQQGGLVGLDGEQVVGLLGGHQELGGLAVGLERVGGDHHAGQLQVGQQRLEPGNLARCAVDLALGEHRTGGVVHRGEQVDWPALGACGAAERLAVDRDRPPSMPLSGTVTVGKPCADRGGERFGVQPCQGPADRRLTERGPVSGERITPCTQRRQDGLWHVRGPFDDRGHRLGAGQDRGSGDGKDRNQRVPAPRPSPRIIDRGKVGEQVRWFGWSELIVVSKLGQARRDRG
jgi:hypothetical protein